MAETIRGPKTLPDKLTPTPCTLDCPLNPRQQDEANYRTTISPALAPGPFLGILAMQRLRRLLEAAQIAQGRR